MYRKNPPIYSDFPLDILFLAMYYVEHSTMDNIVIDRDIIRNHLDTIILHLLTEQDRYGFEICKEVSIRSEGAYELKESSLYSAFRRLENAGYAASYWGDDKSRGARRKYYTITDTGKVYYRHTVREWITVKRLMGKLIGSDDEIG